MLVFIACCRSGQHKADVALVLQEALRFYNVTTKQKEMLEFALNYLQTDDEVGGAAPGAAFFFFKTPLVIISVFFNGFKTFFALPNARKTGEIYFKKNAPFFLFC